MFVGGNFRNHIDKWKVIADETVFKWISSGVELDFKTLPAPFVNKQRSFSPKETSFIDEEIAKLICTGCIQEVQDRPAFLSQIFTVPKANGKLRLVIDLRIINEHIHLKKFVYEDINTVLDVVKPKDSLITLDIKNSFFHIPLNNKYYKYVSFTWKGKYYSWLVLPFGLCSSPYYWSKCNRAVVKHIRHICGISTVCYVDDYLVNDKAGSIEHSKNILLSTLTNLGYFINFDKSSLQPEFHKKYIGYIVDTKKVDDSVFISIPSDRIKKLKRDIRRTLNKGCVSARSLARITGQCVSMAKAVLPAKLLLRNLYRLLQTKLSWRDSLVLDGPSRLDLEWWLDSLSSWNGRCFRGSSKALVQVTCDASKTGYGGAILHQNLEAQGHWDFSMEHRSSNYRELLAVLMTLKSFLPYLRHKSVQFLSDNVTTCAAINFQGTSVRDLDMVAREIFAIAIRNDIQIQARYLPGIQNVHSDYLSRLSPKYEWALNPNLFAYLDELFGPHTVDRFASVLTSQCPRYNSRFLNPYTEVVDALHQSNWSTENNFVNPPFRLLPKVINHIQTSKSTATVIAPFWPSQPWFKKLSRMALCPPLKLPKPRLVCLPVQDCIPEPTRNPKWVLYAWKVSGKID